MQTTHSGTEKLNMLAAGLITALAVHGLFCVASLPAAMEAPRHTFLLGALKVARLLWTVAGIGGSAYLAFQAAGMINGRSYQQARIAGIGALLLPLLGSPGTVTAFALLPLGLLVHFLLKQSDWQMLFRDAMTYETSEEALTETEAEVEAYEAH